VTTRHPARLLLAAAASSLLLVVSACGASTNSSGSFSGSASGSSTTVSGPLNSGPRSSIPAVSVGTGTLAPVVLVPRPRAITGTRAARHVRTSATTCSCCAGNTTASGCAWRRELS